MTAFDPTHTLRGAIVSGSRLGEPPATLASCISRGNQDFIKTNPLPRPRFRNVEVEPVRIKRGLDVPEAVGRAVFHRSADQQGNASSVDVPYMVEWTLFGGELRFRNTES